MEIINNIETFYAKNFFKKYFSVNGLMELSVHKQIDKFISELEDSELVKGLTQIYIESSTIKDKNNKPTNSVGYYILTKPSKKSLEKKLTDRLQNYITPK